MFETFELLRAASWSLLGFGWLGLLVTLLANRALRLASKLDRDGDREHPGISILRPVKGLDPGLAENFAALARQDYPAFEILIGIADADDPALPVARAFAREFPQISVRVLLCPQRTGLNPKVSILEALAREAHHDVVLISDSNVRVGPSYLENLAARLLPGVGLVTNVVVGRGADGLGSRLEVLHLTTFAARATSFARVFLKRACVIGKSMLFRRSDLERVGGFTQVRDVLAEDYVLGHAFARAGLGVALAPDPVPAYVSGWDLSRFINRHLRWAQMRRRISLAGYLVEPLSYPHPFLLLAALCGLAQPPVYGIWIVGLGVVGIGLRLLLDAFALRHDLDAAPSVVDLLLTIPKDCLALGLWLVAGFHRSIDWRGNRFRIGPGSRLEPLHPEAGRIQLSEPLFSESVNS